MYDLKIRDYSLFLTSLTYKMLLFVFPWPDSPKTFIVRNNTGWEGNKINIGYLKEGRK